MNKVKRIFSRFEMKKKLFVVNIFTRSEAFHVPSANFPSYFLALNNKQCREKNEFNMSSCAKRIKPKKNKLNLEMP